MQLNKVETKRIYLLLCFLFHIKCLEKQIYLIELRLIISIRSLFLSLFKISIPTLLRMVSIVKPHRDQCILCDRGRMYNVTIVTIHRRPTPTISTIQTIHGH